MRKIQQFYFALGLGNSILAPIGFMGPGPDWAGVFAGSLAVGAFIVLGVVTHIDERARAEFIRMASRFRTVTIGDEEMQRRIDELEDRIVRHKPLLHISHDIGIMHGELVAKGLLESREVTHPETDI